MSWGERSCKHYSERDCPTKPTLGTCDVTCPHYIGNGRPPDSTPDGSAERRALLAQEGIAGEHAGRMLSLAREAERQVRRDARHNKVAPQAVKASESATEYARFMARAAERVKHKGRGRRRRIRDWSLAGEGKP